MCGLAGISNPKLSENELTARMRPMLDSISHRGPDGEGVFFDAEKHVVLGHRRLAIIDPEHCKQPMTTTDEQLTVVFNYAIYNYLDFLS